MSLTDDDKAWLLESFTERLCATEQRLEQKIDLIEQNLDLKIGRVERQIGHLDLKIDSVERKLEENIGRVERRIGHLDLKIDSVERKLEERIERVETSLLTEFHKWASPQEARARTHAAALRAIDLEMEALSDRVAKLEPPAA